MGMMDAFTAEDRVNLTFSDFYALMRESSKAELVMNAVKCDVPHRHIREMMTGKSEAPALPVQDAGEAGDNGAT